MMLVPDSPGFCVRVWLCETMSWLVNRVPMGRDPYKFAKKGMGVLSSVSTFNHKRAPMYVDSNSMPSNQLTANKCETELATFIAQDLMACNTMNSNILYCEHGDKTVMAALGS